MNWYLTLMTQKYASFSGRARRTEYWMFFLVYFVIALVIGVVEGLLSIGGYLTGIFALVHLLPSLGVTVRRLHDTGRSGWWILLSFIPIIGALVLLYFMVISGEPQDNAYGPNPKTAWTREPKP